MSIPTNKSLESEMKMLNFLLVASLFPILGLIPAFLAVFGGVRLILVRKSDPTIIGKVVPRLVIAALIISFQLGMQWLTSLNW